MIRSMTGYGCAEVATSEFVLAAEIRTVNNRNLKVSMRLPDRLLGCEIWIEKIVRQRLERGAVQLTLDFQDTTGDTGYTFDLAAMRRYCQELERVREELHCVGEVTFNTLVSLPGVLRKTQMIENISPLLREKCAEVVNRALDDAIRMREREGEFLWREVQKRRDMILALLDKIEARAQHVLELHRQRLRERIGKLFEGINIQFSDSDIEKELVIFADRCDISEEIARLRSHLLQLERLHQEEAPAGRKLEFLAQEMLREANTLASKASDAQVTQDALEIKNEVEKIREQALNVE